jgi:hypothetical protein
LTVERNQKKEFLVSLDYMINLVRKVLSEKQGSYTYIKTVEGKDGTSFSTVIKPNLYPLLLSTRLYIEITKAGDDRTAVEVKTKSQWFITGDIFNCYNRYIRKFLMQIEDEIKNS